MSYRRQKRWWNSYILFYERHDAFQSDDEKDLTKSMQDLTIGKWLVYSFCNVLLKESNFQFTTCEIHVCSFQQTELAR